MKDNTLWVEKYRPDNLDNYIGNEHVKEKLAQYIQEQDIPHILFYGSAGTGKTTAAKILCKSIDADVMMINGSSENGIDIIRNKITNFASTMGFSPLKIVFLDEADYITPEGQAGLRNTMEVFSNNTRFILTCNYIERISSPIISRTQAFSLTPPSKKEVANHLIKILHAENVEYDAQSVATIVKAYYPDVRKIINVSQQSVKKNKLIVNIQNLISSDAKLQILDTLMGNLPYNDKITSIRKIIADNDIKDFTDIYRMLYDNVTDYASSNKISRNIILIAEAQYRDAFVIDKEINFVSTLYQMLE